MRFDVFTIFPSIINGYLDKGIIARGYESGLIQINIIDLRDFTEDLHRTTDDRPYGGGAGMVMKPEPIWKAVNSVERLEKSLVVLLTPCGQRFDQKKAWEFAEKDHILLICGRYEGVDERIADLCVDIEISIGDYVLSGGELGALVIMDAVGRLVPGVLGDENSAFEDSFKDNLLEYPHYTRPVEFKNINVPDVLLSGHHKEINRWRRTQSLKKTLKNRPDLLENAVLSDEDRQVLFNLKLGQGEKTN